MRPDFPRLIVAAIATPRTALGALLAERAASEHLTFPDNLTPGERRSIAGQVRGLTQGEIAHACGVTRNTVHLQIASARRKLGGISTAELLSMYRQAMRSKA